MQIILRVMKLKQIIKVSTCAMALAGILITLGCGEDATDPNDENDPVNAPPPVLGEDGPTDSKEEGGTEGN